MAVDTPTKRYDYLLPIWTKIRVAALGQAAVKSAENSLKYLPCPAGYNKSWYSGALHRAYWFGATGTTIEAYQGAIFRKPATLAPELKDSPDEQQELLKSIDNKGNDLDTFATNTANEILKTSYGGILVDFDNTEGKVLTQEQSNDLGLRARLIYYPAESIFHPTKNSVRLYETYNDETDEFADEPQQQIKVLDIVKIEQDGQIIKKYRQRIFRKVDTAASKDEAEWMQHGEDMIPTWPGGENLGFIPFQFIGASSNDFDPDAPIVEGLVNANFQHFGLYSDFREAIHWIRPFIYGTGLTDKEEGQQEQVINSNVMLTDRNPNAKYGILEFSGSGLQWDIKALELLEAQMASMGGDALRSRKNAAESADKARIDKSSESSVLATLANNVSSAISISINIMMKWNGQGDTDFVYKLNTDYDPTLFDAQLMTAINKSVEMRTMSQKTAIENFKKGELVNGSVEDEILQIDDEQSDLGNNEETIELISNIVDLKMAETADAEDST